MIWCEQRIDNAMMSCLCRANCPVLCCVLVGGVASDWQYGCNLREGKKHGDQETSKEEKTKRGVHNNTYTWYCCSLCLKESTAQHDTAPQLMARHGTARCCAALVSYIYSWADLSWACIHCDSTPWYLVCTNLV